MNLRSATETRRNRRKARTAGAILEAAERLFLTRGYHATTVEQLAEEADVAVGSLYGHFGGKEGIYAALIERALELDQRYCDQGWASGGEDPIGRLVGLADGYLRFASENVGYFRIFRFPPPDAPTDGPVGSAAERVTERIRSETERMAGAIAEAIEARVMRDVDPRRAAVFLWAAWDGVIAAHLLPGNMGLTELEFEQVLSLGRQVLTLGLLDPQGGVE
ncbi:TetR family transcriptional regulator [Mycobacterium kubicae]|uniref:TetR family transcriptional regulator n=1 Tax=Mycobacterium kubicae TaxID=120959 RepID=A0AAX1J9N8_9MYCO|nr:TetR/AcrR family transcriptional regulator [Mycobacterium kubicae]MCV7093878.1 TetR/AcrR family transcriptional regulator [Mycobacterium kubicae]ORW00667.1 TetR family transcriptional regulator [Mycobacterium kubicae]QNI05006.1 TetR/AcrR family transcriptional regulator [Mycobacterium kubicae]QNI09992.1 TetR/AcrR family transcriptional regulator [Mycobacterium kubicae]QPI38194.1 TetR/AcrR family transcriptional regulator [Mycobacterium kubicae]